MAAPIQSSSGLNLPPIYILSGGVGASGDQLVHTVLAQFPTSKVPVIMEANLRYTAQVERVVQQAATSGGTIVHTLVDSNLRDFTIQLCREKGVCAIDLMGELLEQLAAVLGQEPLEQPGLYRKLHKDYFERVSAIEYTMAHDDGKNPPGWEQADIVLVGVSRTGKTPLSMYLSVLGWKVANVPLVPELGVPAALYHLKRDGVIGLTVEPGQLLIHRQHRQRRLGAAGSSNYIDPDHVYQEVQAAIEIFRQMKIAVIDVTDKPIESSADEIIRIVTGRRPP